MELYVPKREDLGFRQKMMSDPATMSYNRGYEPFPGYRPDTGCIDFPKSAWDAWYDKWIGNSDRFYAYIQEDGKWIGAWIGEVCLHRTPEKDWWDMGIVLYAPFRGKGRSKPALELLLEQAFTKCGANRVHNYFESSREAALRLHRAVGFTETAREDGVVHLLLTREQWEAKHAALSLL